MKPFATVSLQHPLLEGTIVFSIHQPRYSIFKLFDRILLLSHGRTIFHRPAIEMITHFNAQGYQCELHDNPADFVLDLLIDASLNRGKCKSLDQAYQTSSMQTTLKRFFVEQRKEGELSHSDHHQGRRAARSFIREAFYVAQQTLRNAIRTPALFVAQIIVAVILGVLIGLVFYDLKKTTDPGVQNRGGAIFFMIVSQIFSTVTALEPLLKERVLFIHVGSSFLSLFPVDPSVFLLGASQWLLSNWNIFLGQADL